MPRRPRPMPSRSRSSDCSTPQSRRDGAESPSLAPHPSHPQPHFARPTLPDSLPRPAMSPLSAFAPRLAQTLRSTPAGVRAFRTTTIVRASAGYGSGPAETTDSSGTADSGASTSKDGQSSADKATAAGQPKPNSSSEKSAGDKSKPHYECEPDNNGTKKTPELKKPEDKCAPRLLSVGSSTSWTDALSIAISPAETTVAGSSSPSPLHVSCFLPRARILLLCIHASLSCIAAHFPLAETGDGRAGGLTTVSRAPAWPGVRRPPFSARAASRSASETRWMNPRALRPSGTNAPLSTCVLARTLHVMPLRRSSSAIRRDLRCLC
jgi:hypothetical protein